MLKKIIIALFIIFACAVPVFASWTEVIREFHGSHGVITIWTDDEYGVQYIVFETDSGVGICPRCTNKERSNP